MPTLRGWAALGAALALALLWVGFGEQLLLALAAFFLVAVLLGSLYVRRAGLNVAMGRVVAPIQVHDGDRAIVEVTMTSSRRLHEAVVEDIVHGLGRGVVRCKPGATGVANGRPLRSAVPTTWDLQTWPGHSQGPRSARPRRVRSDCRQGRSAGGVSPGRTARRAANCSRTGSQREHGQRQLLADGRRGLLHAPRISAG